MPPSKQKVPIQSTAGAIPIRNEKGEVTMEKVKVSRYVSGKRPEYAGASSDEEDDLEFSMAQKKAIAVTAATVEPSDQEPVTLPDAKTDAEKVDRRLRRLIDRQKEEEEDSDDDDDIADRAARRRQLHEPQVLARSSDEEDDDEEDAEDTQRRHEMELEESSEEEELDDEEIERRRALLREKAKQRRQEQDKEVMDVEEEKDEKSEEEEESSEYEEYTDSEEEETGPRLKPVFVRKKDRITIQEKEREAQKQRELEQEAKKLVEERRRQTLKMVETEIKKELEQEKVGQDPLEGGSTDEDANDNDEEEYESWKVRELKRIKRDREEREAMEKEKMELERLHNMNEDESRDELKRNPRQITNKAAKGKYKFLQKYYHRGAFFMETSEDVYQRDYSVPTLEDHFDKTVLPKVMQVKNFGRSGRTKYTHLVDQDSTQFDSPWMADQAMNLKFHTSKGGGMKQGFERPSLTKKRK